MLVSFLPHWLISVFLAGSSFDWLPNLVYPKSWSSVFFSCLQFLPSWTQVFPWLYVSSTRCCLWNIACFLPRAPASYLYLSIYIFTEMPNRCLKVIVSKTKLLISCCHERELLFLFQSSLFQQMIHCQPPRYSCPNPRSHSWSLFLPLTHPGLQQVPSLKLISKLPTSPCRHSTAGLPTGNALPMTFGRILTLLFLPLLVLHRPLSQQLPELFF